MQARSDAPSENVSRLLVEVVDSSLDIWQLRSVVSEEVVVDHIYLLTVVSSLEPVPNPDLPDGEVYQDDVLRFLNQWADLRVG